MAKSAKYDASFKSQVRAFIQVAAKEILDAEHSLGVAIVALDEAKKLGYRMGWRQKTNMERMSVSHRLLTLSKESFRVKRNERVNRNDANEVRESDGHALSGDVAKDDGVR